VRESEDGTLTQRVVYNAGKVRNTRKNARVARAYARCPAAAAAQYVVLSRFRHLFYRNRDDASAAVAAADNSIPRCKVDRYTRAPPPPPLQLFVNKPTLGREKGTTATRIELRRDAERKKEGSKEGVLWLQLGRGAI
jgi:hypothetical protein